MTTIHSYTGDQPTLDTHAQGSLPRPRRGAEHRSRPRPAPPRRSASCIPELKGKLDGASIRVPTPNVSLVDFKFVAKRPTTVEEVNNAIKDAAEVEPPHRHPRPRPRSRWSPSDFNHDPHSSTFALDQTKVIDGKFVRVVAWYDNEWGFSNRMADTAVAMGKLI